MTPEATVETAATVEMSYAHVKHLRWLLGFGRPVLRGKIEGVDLDLLAAGYVERSEKDTRRLTSMGAELLVTPAGVAFLQTRRERKAKTLHAHSTLGERLALHLEEKGLLTWQNTEIVRPDRAGAVRPDVYALDPRAMLPANTKTAIYEVKVSRADFRAELSKPMKTESYRLMAEALYYVCPDGMISVGEVPKGIGLLCEVQQEGGEPTFELRRRAARTKGFEVPANVLLTLLVKQHRRFSRELEEMSWRLPQERE